MGGVRVPRAIQTRDPELLAAKAGLDYVPDDEPGYLRRRCGKGFSYLDLDGCVIGDHERERLEALVIPPAWTNVWMAPVPTAHLLATGRDADGRKQRKHHPLQQIRVAGLAPDGRLGRRRRGVLRVEDQTIIR